MSRTVFCRKYQEELEGLDFPPMPGKKGEDIEKLRRKVLEEARESYKADIIMELQASARYLMSDLA